MKDLKKIGFSILISSLLMVVPVSVFAEGVSFSSFAEYPIPSTPESIAVGDFNGDGIPDLVTANPTGNNISILLGDSDGTYGSSINYSVTQPWAVAVGDLNGDGILDIATANANANTVSILLGNGDGTFENPINYLVGSQGSGTDAIAIHDLNGDGIPDIVVPNTNSSNIAVLLGNGDGTFQPVHTISVSGGVGSSIVVGDFNGDGIPDVVIPGGGGIDVLLGKGGGAFNTATSYAGGRATVSIASGDFNNDGKLDIATANYAFGANDISVLLGNGEGTFGAPTNFPAGQTPKDITIGDFNNDGNTDIAVTNQFPPSVNSVSVLTGNGDGTFGTPTSFQTGYIPMALATSDLNEDGTADIAIADQSYHDGVFGKAGVLINTTPVTTLTLHPTGNRITHEGQTLTFEVVVTNPNDDYLTYSAVNLPPGATFDPNTHIFTWTPNFSQSGYYQNIQFNVADNTVPALSKAETISIVVLDVQPVSIMTTTLSPATVGQQISYPLTAINGLQPYMWSVMNGDLPNGMLLDVNAETISGTPTTDGTSTFTIEVQDAVGQTATQSLSLVVNPASITNNSPILSPLSNQTTDVGQPIQFTVSASDPDAGQTVTLSASNLPTGATFDPATGIFNWTPGAGDVGTYSNVTFTATDNGTPPLSTSTSATITVNPAPSITTTSLPEATNGTPYTQAIQTTGGTTPFTWSVSSGSLPAGLSLDQSTGVISGTPTVNWAANFSVTVKDASGASATQALSLVVANPLTITTNSLIGGKVGAAYMKTVKATGGVTSYTWSVVSGTLPDGLALNASTGVISGTPTIAGTYPFTLQVADADGLTVATDFTLTINTLHVSTPSLPDGTVGASYAKTLGAAGGSTPYAWSILSGTLPAGLTLNSSGSITGTPAAVGTSYLTVQVTDTNGVAATSDFSVTVNQTTITTASLPNGKVGNAYTKNMAASHGTSPYTWSVASGALPDGLTLSSSGTISGTPTTAETSNVTIEATDANGVGTTQAYTLVVNS